MRLKWAVATAAAIATTAIGSAAHADELRGFDWMQALVDLDRFARGSASADRSASAQRPSPRTTSSDDPSPHNLGNAWFGVAPRVTLVARDWASSTRLAGDRLSLVETMRLAASTRMVVGRARLSATRFTPFLQVGLGQWRVDRTYLPLIPGSIEIASQLGTGFELRITPRWQLAAEATMTSLIREGHNTSVIPQSMLWSTLVASQIEF
ncbi:MAG TPA: hypothetical protein VM580_30385 [Labilithrix sp.]|nr:hypothetical protein [Labilithrix sp.]